MRFCGERPSGRSRGLFGWHGRLAVHHHLHHLFHHGHAALHLSVHAHHARGSRGGRCGRFGLLTASSPYPCHQNYQRIMAVPDCDFHVLVHQSRTFGGSLGSLHFFVHFLHRLHLTIKGVGCWRGSSCWGRLGSYATALRITGVVACVFVRGLGDCATAPPATKGLSTAQRRYSDA